MNGIVWNYGEKAEFVCNAENEEKKRMTINSITGTKMDTSSKHTIRKHRNKIESHSEHLRHSMAQICTFTPLLSTSSESMETRIDRDCACARKNDIDYLQTSVNNNNTNTKKMITLTSNNNDSIDAISSGKGKTNVNNWDEKESELENAPLRVENVCNDKSKIILTNNNRANIGNNVSLEMKESMNNNGNNNNLTDANDQASLSSLLTNGSKIGIDRVCLLHTFCFPFWFENVYFTFITIVGKI